MWRSVFDMCSVECFFVLSTFSSWESVDVLVIVLLKSCFLLQSTKSNQCSIWVMHRRENYFKIWLHFCGTLLVLLQHFCRYNAYFLPSHWLLNFSYLKPVCHNSSQAGITLCNFVSTYALAPQPSLQHHFQVPPPSIDIGHIKWPFRPLLPFVFWAPGYPSWLSNDQLPMPLTIHHLKRARIFALTFSLTMISKLNLPTPFLKGHTPNVTNHPSP